MKRLIKLTTVFLLGLISCSDNKTAQTPALKADSIQKNVLTNKVAPAPTSIPDTIKRFIVDDYPLADEMFGNGDNGREINSGDIVSVDKAWFTNDELGQTMVVEVYTDNFRMAEFHFQNQDIPKALIKRMELHTKEGELASQQQKEKNFKGFIKTAIRISKKYFTTKKGFKLGDNKQKAMQVYGSPDRKTIDDTIEILEWDFTGDLLYDGKSDLKGKPLAKDNYGHQVTLFFRNNKLIGIILHNDIP